MLLSLTDGLLLIFITLSLGILGRSILEKIFQTTIQTDLPGIFLLGLFGSTLYFNLISFWLSVNYFSLIPLAIGSLIVCVKFPGSVLQIRRSLRDSLKCTISPSNLLISLCLAATLGFYWILPAANTDSAGYHYLSILWYEKYKVVPGLANLHGRFAFNPVSFIIQAAYSFTGPLGQSIYPLNPVLIGLFFAWLLKKLLRQKDSPAGWLYAVLIVLLYRSLLINISSPSSDAMVDICIAYSMISLFERLLSGDLTTGNSLVPCLIIIYSFTAKLSSFPIAPILIYIFFLLPKKERTRALVWRFLGICALLYIPWLARNYILCGYLIYPYPYLNFFHPDWQVPYNVLRHNVFFLQAKKENLNNPYILIAFNRDFLPTLLSSLRHSSPNLLLMIAALLSPFSWLVLYRRGQRPDHNVFWGWFILYAGVWWLLYISPIFRFGAVVISLSILFPFFACLSGRPAGKPGPWSFLVSLLVISTAIYYIVTGYRKPSTYPFSLADCWLYPLKDGRYRNNKADFPYTILKSGVKL